MVLPGAELGIFCGLFYFPPMQVQGNTMTAIWPHPTKNGVVQIIDQRFLPHQLVVEDLDSLESTAKAIEDMHVRGAPLIGVTAAWGVAIAAIQWKEAQDSGWSRCMAGALDRLSRTRPTAVNLFWALDRQRKVLESCSGVESARDALWREALRIMEEDVETCRQIGQNGLRLIREIAERKRKGESLNPVVNILTHCNAGWLACVDHGTATAPIYAAFGAGIPVHVWVDETRPRNQGAKLTAWELGQHGVPHTLIPDNAGGHLMQHGLVDLVIVGADRVTAAGDVANKIGTYLKALAAHDNGVPFYVALPSSTIDWNMQDGVAEIPIETRSENEVRMVDGMLADGSFAEVLICPQSTRAVNYGFDVTPHRLITGIILENGIFEPSVESLAKAQTERNSHGVE